MKHSLTARLTFWYSGIFALTSLSTLLFFYLSISDIFLTQTDEKLLNELTEFKSIFSENGTEGVKKEIMPETESQGKHGMFRRLWDVNGRSIASSDMSLWGDVNISENMLKTMASDLSVVYETRSLPRMRSDVRIVYGVLGSGLILQLGQSLGYYEDITEKLKTLAILMIVGLAFFSPLVWISARRALSGVDRVRRTAVGITRENLDQRVEVKSKTKEIEDLETAFNSMLDRISALVREMRETNDNIAHDLKSPITRIRAGAEALLNGSVAEINDATMGAAADTIEECDRLISIIDDVLDIAETEAGAVAVVKKRTNITDLLNEACELFQPLADETGVELVSWSAGVFWVDGDARKLQRMIGNLLDNAMKFTPSPGTVRVSLTGNGESIVISIADTGIGIPESEHPRIFDRFYRCDKSRSNDGAGLGLSLARAIARSHDGDLHVTSFPGRGSTFTVTLPQRPSS